MSKYWIKLGLFTVFTFMISSSSFIKKEEEDKLYVIQLSSSTTKIWTDIEVRDEIERFESLKLYGFIYETSYLGSEKIAYSKLLLGTYENEQTAKKISDKINNEKGFDTFVKSINKREALSINHSIKKTFLQNGKLSKVIEYSNLENEGGAGTILIKSISENMYSFTAETYDESLKLPNSLSVPILSPPKLEPENNIDASTSISNGTTNTSEIPKKRTAIPKPNGGVLNPKYHIVEENETLYSLAKKYDVTTEYLMKLNNLKDVFVNVGQELQIRE